MITLRVISSHKGQMEFTLDEVLDALGIREADNSTLIMTLKRDGRALTALASDDLDYPGINLDGSDEHGQSIYLAQAELPNQDYPKAICVRLYAGYEQAETDEPLAMVRNDLMEPIQVCVKGAAGPTPRTVYLDEKLAVVEPYENAKED